jgi:hypothetical protein
MVGGGLTQVSYEDIDRAVLVAWAADVVEPMLPWVEHGVQIQAALPRQAISAARDWLKRPDATRVRRAERAHRACFLIAPLKIPTTADCREVGASNGARSASRIVFADIEDDVSAGEPSFTSSAASVFFWAEFAGLESPSLVRQLVELLGYDLSPDGLTLLVELLSTGEAAPLVDLIECVIKITAAPHDLR